MRCKGGAIDQAEGEQRLQSGTYDNIGKTTEQVLAFFVGPNEVACIPSIPIYCWNPS